MNETKNDFKLKDIQFHKQTASAYDESIVKPFRIYHSYSLHPFLDKVLSIDKPMRTLNAMDIGCGTGVVSLALATKGFNVVAVDHSPEMIQIASTKARTLGLSSIKFEIGDVEHLRYSNNEFDIITCQGLLHHLENMKPTLLELNRVLKSRGFFYISEPCNEPTILKKTAVKSIKLLVSGVRFIRFFNNKGLKPENASLEAPISPIKLLEILNELGLNSKVEYMTHVPFLDRFLPDFVRLFIAKMVSLPWKNRKGDIIFIYGQKN